MTSKPEEQRITRRSYIPRVELTSDLNALNEDLTDSALGLETDDDAEDAEDEQAIKEGSSNQDQNTVGSGQAEEKVAEVVNQQQQSPVKAQDNQNVPVQVQAQTVSAEPRENQEVANSAAKSQTVAEKENTVNVAKQAGAVQAVPVKAEDSQNVEEKATENQNTPVKAPAVGSQRVQLISDALGDIGQAAHAVNLERKSDIIHSLPKETETASGDDSGSDNEETRADTIKNLFSTLGENEDTETAAAAVEPKPASAEADKRSQTVWVHILSDTNDIGNVHRTT